MKFRFLLLLFLIFIKFLVKINNYKIKFYIFYMGILNLRVNFLRKLIFIFIFLKGLLEKRWLERLESNIIYYRVRKGSIHF